MANILVLKSSILGQYSQSNALIDGYWPNARVTASLCVIWQP